MYYIGVASTTAETVTVCCELISLRARVGQLFIVYSRINVSKGPTNEGEDYSSL